MSKAWSEKNKTTNTRDFKNKEDNYASRNVNGTGLQDHRLAARPEDHDGRQPRLVGQADRQRDRGRTRRSKSDPTRASRRCCRATSTCSPTCRRRTSHGCAPTPSSRSSTAARCAPSSSRSTRAAGTEILRRQGKNPFGTSACAGAEPRHRSRDDQAHDDARPVHPGRHHGRAGRQRQHAEIDVALKADPEKAKKLLAEAGYPDGFEFQLNCPNNRYVNDGRSARRWSRCGPASA